jgi:thiamine biosynthesis lipoprotein
MARPPAPARVLLALPLLTATLALAPPRDRPAGERITLSGEAMGTTFTVIAEGADADGLTRAARAALDEAVRLDGLLSNYRSDSEWSLVNREAGRRPVRVSPELFGVLAASLEYARRTDGAFDVTVGPLMKAWGFFNAEGALPDPSVLAQARARVGSAYVRLDPSAGTVEFARPGIELDPGGIGKGYAVDRMVAVLSRSGVAAAFVSAGGSSIYGLGTPAGDPRGWLVRLRDPRAAARTAAEIHLRNASLSTSGSYEKFFRAGGQVYSHIMDPRTGRPAAGTSSVSVLAPRAIDGDAWTTAFFVHGRAWARERRPAGMRVFLCDDDDRGRCAWVE